MEIQELESLEEKTKEIVETLSALEAEIKAYQDKNLNIDDALGGLSDLSQKIITTTKELSLVIEILKTSDLSKSLEELDEKIDKLESLYNETESSNNKIIDMQDKLSEAIANITDSINESSNKILLWIADADKRIDRIDRNTQKGFRKEKAEQ